MPRATDRGGQAQDEERQVDHGDGIQADVYGGPALGAEIVTRKGERFAVWTADGRRHRAPLTPDGTRITLERAGYTIQYFDHAGKRRKKTYPVADLDTAKQIAAEREKAAMLRRKGYVDPAQERLAKEARRPLAEHLADFKHSWTTKGTRQSTSGNLRNIRWVIDNDRPSLLPT